MEQSPSGEVDNLPDSQIPCHYHVHKAQPLALYPAPDLSNPRYRTKFLLRFILILSPSTPRSAK
jgi:hypothetical protein